MYHSLYYDYLVEMTYFMSRKQNLQSCFYKAVPKTRYPSPTLHRNVILPATITTASVIVEPASMLCFMVLLGRVEPQK